MHSMDELCWLQLSMPMLPLPGTYQKLPCTDNKGDGEGPMAEPLIPNNTAADFLHGAALDGSHCISYPKPVCLRFQSYCPCLLLSLKTRVLAWLRSCNTSV